MGDIVAGRPDAEALQVSAQQGAGRLHASVHAGPERQHVRRDGRATAGKQLEGPHETTHLNLNSPRLLSLPATTVKTFRS